MIKSFKVYITSIFLLCTALPVHANSEINPITVAQNKFAKLEKEADGRLGICAVNTANNMRIDYHANERFPMGCTSKVMGVAAILKQSMKDKNLLQEKVFYNKSDLALWSPKTAKYVDSGMTVEQLCEASITASDNTAMNLLAKRLGGAHGITQFARSINDNTFRLDHEWPKEGLACPGDVQDTTSPAAMEKSLQQLVFGNVLGVSERVQLLDWMKHNTTGDARIRAGVPKGWMVADKTGTGFYYAITNDIAIIWPPNSKPIVVAMFFYRNKKDAEKREDVLAAATRIIIETSVEDKK